MAVVFNCRPNGDKVFGDAVAQALDKGSAAVKTWPSHNLFGKVKKSALVPGRGKKLKKKRRQWPTAAAGVVIARTSYFAGSV